MLRKFFNLIFGGTTHANESRSNGEMVREKRKSLLFRGVEMIKILMCFFAFFAMTNTSAQLPGSGTAADPYTIATAEQLVEFAGYINANSTIYNLAGVQFKLTADLDLSEYGENYRNGAGWMPIGSNSPTTARFKGVFDGNGHVITGLYINNTTTTLLYMGLFGYLETNGTIKNLGIENAVIINRPAAASTFTGSIAGYLGTSHISNCWFTGTINSSANTTNCTGGIVGDILTNCTVNNCYSMGSITATAATTVHNGGIVGRNSASSVLNCWSTISVNSTGATVNSGGIIGTNTGTLATLITENCAALNPLIKATVTGAANTGRIVGNNVATNMTSNIGLNNMGNMPNVVWSNIGANLKDGDNITLSEIITDGTLGGRFTTPIWTTQNGKLPGFGEAVTLPGYMTGEVNVYGVVLNPKNFVIKKGETRQMNTVVVGFNHTGEFTLSVEGGVEGTSISSTGLLTIANNESSLLLQVKAVSDENTSLADSTFVHVSAYIGAGTETDPYIITTAAQLAQLATYVNAVNPNFISQYYKLGNDIDLSEYGEDYRDGAGWLPIGTNVPTNARFSGIFDGDGHVITGLYINNTTLGYVGLFGYLQTQGTIKNLGVENAVIINSSDIANNYTGGIAGYVASSHIANCWVTGTITSATTTTNYTGGIAGEIGPNSSAINCYSMGSVTATATGTIYSGGVIGSNFSSIVTNCWSTMSVNARSATVNAGGIMGRNAGAIADLSIHNNAALNPVINAFGTTATNYGRIVGNNIATNISNNVALSNMANLPNAEEWTNIGADQKDGANITVSELLADGTLDGRFTTPTWTTQTGMLPGFGNAVTPPGYITGDVTILDVIIAPKNFAMKKGETEQMSANVVGFNQTGAVTWSLEGGSEGTSISSTGLVTVANNESSILLQVKAVSNEDATIADSTFVHVLIYDGEGTALDPYIITTPAQLAQLATYVNQANPNFNNKHYKLANDIDLSEYGEYFNDGQGWIPIGTNVIVSSGPPVVNARFFGFFDGDGHVITGLYMNNTTVVLGVGLFGYLSDGEVKNLGIIDANITSTISAVSHVGGIVGYGMRTNISKCFFTGSITASATGGSLFGLIVGYTWECVVKDCWSTGIIISTNSTTSYVGGISGAASGTTYTYISNCWTSALIMGNGHAGGVVGINGNSGNTQNTVALNPAVRGTTVNKGRVAGRHLAATSVLNNNYAFEDMLNLPDGAAWVNIGADNIDGADITYEDILEDPTLFGIFDNSEIWKTQVGMLPGLLAPVPIPTYLTGAPYIIGISIEPKLVTLQKGDTQLYEASVLGVNITGGDVTWSVEGAVEGTTITSGGLLTIAMNETNPILVIRATSTDDPEVSQTTLVFVDQFTGGDGSEEDPYIITTAAELAMLSDVVNAGSDLNLKHYKLGNNIDLSEYGENYNDGKGWIPIGSVGTNYFKGVLDGDNQEITGLYINLSFGGGGFFGTMNGTVKNLGLIDVNVTTAGNAGSIAGSSSIYNEAGQNDTTRGIVNSCYATGSVTGTSTGNVGGLLGSSGGLTSNCYFIGTVTQAVAGSSGNTGGITGYNYGTSANTKISNCYFIGDVIGGYIAGGIAANVLNNTVIENCYSMGTVTVPPGTYSGCYAGGIAGSNNATITNCWSTVAVSGHSNQSSARFLTGITYSSDAGGVASVTNNAALNPSLSAFEGGGNSVIGRVNGVNRGVLTNNVGFEFMINPGGTTDWPNKGLNNLDGADITLQQINTDGTLGGRFLPENGWTVENGKLPGLLGSAVDMPFHLVLPTDIYNVSGKIIGNNAPGGIAGALITISTPGFPTFTALTNETGDYLIENGAYDTKTYTVKIEAVGYAHSISTIMINGANAVINATLIEIPFPVSDVFADQNGNADVTVTWEEPGALSEYRFDSGISSGVGIGFANRPNLSVLGTAHRVGATLNKMSWFSTGYNSPVNVFVFGLNDNGLPNRFDLIYTAQNVPNTSQEWCEYEFPMPVYAPNGFFIGVGSTDAGNVTLGLDEPNDDYPFQGDTHYYNSNYTSQNFARYEANYRYANAMIRAEGVTLGTNLTFGGKSGQIEDTSIQTQVGCLLADNSDITSDQLEIIETNLKINTNHSALLSPSGGGQGEDSRTSATYKVYLLEDGSPEFGWVPLADNFTGTEFVDDELWPTLPAGAYRYAVKANYADNVTSPAVLSNLIGRDWLVNYRVNITLNTGEPATGAVVRMKHHNNDPEHDYTLISDATGVTFVDIWRGEYELTITLDGYYVYFVPDLNTEAGLTHNATLFEIPYPVILIAADIDFENDNAEVEWWPPAPQTIFRYDSGVIPPANAIGYTGGGEHRVLGTCFNVSATLTSMTWFTSDPANTYVNVFVFALGADGKPTNTIIYSDLNVPNFGAEWTTYCFNNLVEAPNGFFIAISHNSNNVSLGLNSHTSDYPLLIQYQFLGNTQTGVFTCLSESTFSGNFMIRAEGIVNGEKMMFGYDKGCLGYNVYRLEKDQPESGWQEMVLNTTALNYTDNTWNELAMGDYQYAVKAVYTDGVLSTPKLSKVLPKDMYVDFQLNITTNSGHPATGAEITLTNQDGIPHHIYKLISGADGALIENVRKGMYIINITLLGYNSYNAYNVSIMEDGASRDVELTDIIFPVGSVTATLVENNAIIEWKLEKSYIWDDGSADNGLRIDPNASQWLGNIFPVGEAGIITSVDLYGLNGSGTSSRPLTLDIFDANFNLVGSSETFLIPAGAWLNIPLDNIPYSGTFYAMVKWSNLPGQTNYLGMDQTGPFSQLDYSMFSGDGTTVRTLRSVNAQYVCVFMVRANALVSGEAVKYGNGITQPFFTPSYDFDFYFAGEQLGANITSVAPECIPPKVENRALMGYVVYRLLQGQPEAAWTELADNVLLSEYADTEWSGLAEGTYQYAVKAKFGSGLSPAVLSNALVKEPAPDYFTVTVVAGTGGTVEIVGYTGLSAEIEAGTSVTVKATANAPIYEFIDWTDTVTGESISSLPVYSFTVSKDVTLVANFEQVGINGMAISGYTIYPNPATSELRVESGEWRVESIEIFDMTGIKQNFDYAQLPKAESGRQNGELVVDVSHLPAGVYMIRIFDGQNYVTQRFVKK